MTLEKWFTNKKIPLLVFIAITLILIWNGRNIKINEHKISNDKICSVEIFYSGMNSSYIEKKITVPLENKLSSLNKLSEIRSVTEDNKVILYLTFSADAKANDIYLNVEASVNDFYKSLNLPIQKPKIYFDSSSNNDSFIFAIFSDFKSSSDLKLYDDLTIALESLEEVSRVEIYGNLQKEILVQYENDKNLIHNIYSQDVSKIIQKANPQDSFCSVKNNFNNEKFKIKTKLKDLDDFNQISFNFNEQQHRLSDFAKINIASKDSYEIVRLNGKECIEVEVQAKSSANSIFLSKKCKNIINNFFKQNEYVILLDSGFEQYKKIKKITIALIQSILLLLLIIPLFFNNKFIVLITLLFGPVVLIWTVLIFSAFGFEINEFIIGGISISLGVIIDPVLVISEKKYDSINNTDFIKNIKSIIPSLISSTGTNLIVFIPFFFAEKIMPGISNLVIVIILMTIVSFFISIVFYPCLLTLISVSRNKQIKTPVILKFSERLNKKSCIFIYFFMLLFTFIVLFFMGIDMKWSAGTNMIYADIEFNSERKKEVIDKLIEPVRDELRNSKIVSNFISISRNGSAELKIKCSDKKNISKINELLENLKFKLKDGNIFFNQSEYKKNPGFNIEISIEGPDTEKCRELAKKYASIINNLNKVEAVVLNFKDPGKIVEIIPDASKILKNNMSPLQFGENIYWQLSAPVVDKFWKEGKEYDVRLLDNSYNKVNFEELKNKIIPLNSSFIRLKDAGKINFSKSPGIIHRKNNRCCAFITVYFKYCPLSSAVKELKEIFTNENLPENYCYSFDKKTMEAEDNSREITFAFLAAIALLYILLCGLNEKPVKSLVILSIIPASFAGPMLMKVFSDCCLGPGDLIGMAVAAGIVVNNAILIEADGLKQNIKSILITNLTTIIGAIPVLCSGTEGFVKDLSFYMFFSSVAALILAIFIFPKIIACDIFRNKYFLQG